MKLIAAALVAASLGGCVTADYCADSHPIQMRQKYADWEANYRTCRMMDAAIRYGTPVPRFEVQITN
jgi:hypothetical protein